MKNVNENPYEFFKEGGWSFLGGTNMGESGSDGSDSGSSESDFQEEDDADLSSSSVSESSFSGGSDGSGSGSESFDDDSGEDGVTVSCTVADPSSVRSPTNTTLEREPSEEMRRR